MKKYRNHWFKVLATVFLLAIIPACKTVKAIKMMQATEVEYSDYKSESKQMRFVPMSHISTKAFYSDVERVVKEAKEAGYVLFYEYVDFDKASDVEKRKLRKLVGFIPSKEGYADLMGSLDKEKYTTQDNEQFLHQVNELDFNVDISPQQLLSEYEKQYGELVLSEEDLNTPLTEKIKPSEPNKKMMTVVLDYRNEYLAKAIQESEYSKIIVLYGGRHEKGLVKDLKVMDTTWKKAKK